MQDWDVPPSEGKAGTGHEREGRSMSRYYAVVSLGMVVPDQVDVLRRSQEGVVGWRYRPDKHILDLLFETDVTTEQARLDHAAAGQTVYLILDSQKEVFHIPTKKKHSGRDRGCGGRDAVSCRLGR